MQPTPSRDLAQGYPTESPVGWGPHDNSSIQGHGTKGIAIACLVREPSRSLGWKISRNPQTPALSVTVLPGVC